MSDTDNKDNDFAMDLPDEQIEEPPAFGPAALGLHRVGTVLPPRPPQQPLQVLNARGMPARIRKRNKLFFDDDIINDCKSLRASLSPRKTPKQNSPAKTPTRSVKKRKGIVSRYMKLEKEEEKNASSPPSPIASTSSPVRTASSSNAKHLTKTNVAVTNKSTTFIPQKVIIPADRQVGQIMGLRLRNLLKLPKAHKWVSFEWFYSFIDKPLFEGENDFEICLKELFPKLETRLLTRTEWSRIRMMMGKIRRCSQRFFDEERRELERKRQKIRLLQNKKSGDVNFIKDLPTEIPLPLPVGTKVTARLRAPQDGIFSGTVDAVDSVNSTYRITFDRNNLGSHSIPDYEIVANDFHETLSLSCLAHRPNRSRNGAIMVSPYKSLRGSLNRSDPLLGQEIVGGKFRNPVTQKETIGGFPVKLLELIVRLKKTLLIKQSKLQRLRDMNCEAELMKSREEPFAEDFQRRYASIVISMEKLNNDMQDYLNQVQTYGGELTSDPNLMAMLAPTYLREKCRESADEAVQRNNQNVVNDENMLGLISKLATIMLVASHLNQDANPNSQVLQVFEGCIEEVKNHLNTENVDVFQKSVQIHLHHIRLGLGQMVPESDDNLMTTIQNMPGINSIEENKNSGNVMTGAVDEFFDENMF